MIINLNGSVSYLSDEQQLMVAVALGLIRALSSDSGTSSVASRDPQPYTKRDSSILILKMEKAPTKKKLRARWDPSLLFVAVSFTDFRFYFLLAFLIKNFSFIFIFFVCTIFVEKKRKREKKHERKKMKGKTIFFLLLNEFMENARMVEATRAALLGGVSA